MPNRVLVEAVICLAAVMITGCSTVAPAAESDLAEVRKNPNIIFIFADDMGWGDISVNGHPDIKTPNIDRLALEGTSFHQFTVSNPVCSPSRAAIMTGQYPARHSVHRHFSNVAHNEKFGMVDWLDPEVTLLPRTLRDAGYVTAHFGKWHLTSRHVKDAPLPEVYGYDEAAVFNGPGEQVTYTGLYDRGIDFIRRHKDRPFFLNLWIHETHAAHHPTIESMAKYDHLDFPEQVYAAVVDEADLRIGGILDVLDELDLADDTLIVFSSDNGPAKQASESRLFHNRGNARRPSPRLPKNDGSRTTDSMSGYGLYASTGSAGPFRGHKADTYEGGLRVPFLVRWPGHVPAGFVNDTSIVTAVDLFPTFAEVGGASLPPEFIGDGQSLVRLIKGDTENYNRNKPMFWEWRSPVQSGRAPMLAVRDGDWKLFVHQHSGKVELYNLELDKGETRNVATEYPERVEALRQLAIDWQATLPSAPSNRAISSMREQ